MIRIFIGNLTLIITNTCPRDLSDLAIRCLDHRGPGYIQQDWDERTWVHPPRWSAFIGQLGGKMR